MNKTIKHICDNERTEQMGKDGGGGAWNQIVWAEKQHLWQRQRAKQQRVAQGGTCVHSGWWTGPPVPPRSTFASLVLSPWDGNIWTCRVSNGPFSTAAGAKNELESEKEKRTTDNGVVCSGLNFAAWRISVFFVSRSILFCFFRLFFSPATLRGCKCPSWQEVQAEVFISPPPLPVRGC